MITLEMATANAFRLNADKLSPRLYDTVNTFPGRKQRTPAGPVYELTAANLRHFTERHPDLALSPALLAWYEEACGSKIVARMAVTPATFPYKMPPMHHQRTAMERYWKSNVSYWGLFFEMGTGKTKTTIDLAAIKFLTGQIDIMIVVAPKGVHTQWASKQIPEHMTDAVKFRTYLWRKPRSKYEQKLQKEILENRSNDEMRIVCINIDALNTQYGQEFLAAFVKTGRCMMVVDESIIIKNYRAQRTKNAVELGEQCVVRTILNGAPISNGPQDLFGQMLFLSASILGRKFMQFQYRFLVMGGFQHKQIVGHKNMEDLQQIIDRHCYRVLSEECVDLPEQIFMDRFVELTDDQEEWYRKIKEEILVEFENGDVLDTSMVMTRMIKLQQVCWGYIRDSEGRAVRIDNNRTDAVMDILDETFDGKRRTPTLIFCKYLEEMNVLAERFQKEGVSYRLYNGETSPVDRDQACVDFQDGKFDIFIINSAGYRGLDLWRARQVIWYSLTFSLDEYSQANKRPHRIGQKFSVRYIHLISPGTLDTRLVKALHKKATVSEMLLDIRENL